MSSESLAQQLFLTAMKITDGLNKDKLSKTSFENKVLKQIYVCCLGTLETTLYIFFQNLRPLFKPQVSTIHFNSYQAAE